MGYGADLIVDCSGASIALKSAMEMVRPNGTITKIGWGPQPMDFNLDPLVQKAVHPARLLQPSVFDLGARPGLAFQRTNRSQAHHRRCPIRLGKWEEAFEEMEAGNNVKSVLTPA